MIQSLQRSFVADQSLSDRLFDLLDIVFPEIELQKFASIGRELGASWEAASVPFMKFAEGKAIAHVGVLELPLWIMGQSVRAGGIHAVATHPQFRRQGHYRDCMEAALEYCDTRYKTVVLTTSQPELYYPFNFRIALESMFTVACKESSRKDSFRVLNLEHENDRALLHRLLDTRIPVSNVVGVFSEKAVFFVNEASRSLYYAEDLDALVVMEQESDRLRIFDIVADHSISLVEILKYIPHLVKEITFYFSPDRLEVEAQAIPHVLEDAYLMVRGSFTAEGQPFMLPRSARC
ncbi:MAG: GNAT family N-acetyltransferase [Timaviella obliquedivisa GSE-PSE-MK23-08B]|jgi:GNAT superfamily N-acetyltransferase|nr:GNAT family N-acetyltransferase [Timaviella obliquedivisa GSE-PSE-MK23-08B]